MARTTTKPAAKTAPRKKKTTTKSTAPATRASRNATPATEPASKAATIIGLLGGKGGVSIEDLAVATGWQKHSLRGFLSGILKKRQGINVTSERVDGIRRYRIAGAR